MLSFSCWSRVILFLYWLHLCEGWEMQAHFPLYLVREFGDQGLITPSSTEGHCLAPLWSWVNSVLSWQVVRIYQCTSAPSFITMRSPGQEVFSAYVTKYWASVCDLSWSFFINAKYIYDQFFQKECRLHTFLNAT